MRVKKIINILAALVAVLLTLTALFIAFAPWQGWVQQKLVATLAPSQHRPVALWAGNSAYKASEKRPAQLPSAWLLDKSGKVVESYTGRIPAEAWDRIADLL